MKNKTFHKMISLAVTLLLVFQLIPINSSAVEVYTELATVTMGKYILSPVETYDMGRAGSITLNMYNQEMIVQRDELSLTGGDLFVNIDRYYNSYSKYHDTGDIYGKGWHINYGEKLFYNNDTNRFIYFRDDGSFIEFEKSGLQENGFDKWVEVLDRQGAKLDTLWLPENSLNLSKACIKTIVGKILEFDSLGRLNKISYEDSDSCITISYIQKTDKISFIKDSNGRKYCFEYEDNLLSAIVCKDKNNNVILVSDGDGEKVTLQMKYLYDVKGNLTNVIYPDGEIVSYSYKRSGNLTQITNIDGVNLEIEYNGGLVKQIIKTSESDPNLIKSRISINRPSINSATIVEDGIKKTQSFDKYGYPVYNDSEGIEPLENHKCYDCEDMILSSFVEDDKTPDDTVRLAVSREENSLVKEISAYELKETYVYDETTNLLIEQINGNGGKTEYAYDSNMNLIRMTTTVSNLTNSLMVSNEYNYENDRLSSISHNGFQYRYDYNAFGDIEKTYVGDDVYATYDYESGYGSVWSKIIYSNGQSITATYDEKNNLIGLSYDGGITTAYENVFDENGVLLKTIDNLTKTMIIYANKGMTVLNGDKVVYSIEYIDTNKIGYVVDGQTFTYHYHELNDDESGQILYLSETKTESGSVKTNYITDNKNNVLYRGIKTSDGTVAETHYSYQRGEEKSPFVGTQEFTLENKNDEYNTIFGYSYDKAGNITTVSRNGVITKKYTYDEIGQLISEVDLLNSKSIDYVYDKGGNITKKEIFQYGNSSSKTTSIVYNYEDKNWKDKLTSVNESAITYDETGNPVSYKGNTYNWIGGRILDTIDTKDGKHIEYKYDSNGFRIQKDIYTKTSHQSFKYYWHGNMLTAMKVDTKSDDGKDESNIVVFIYETNAGYEGWQTPVGFVVDGNQYYIYEKNISGDVVAIYNEDAKVASYEYDAYGNITHYEIDKKYNEYLNPFYYRSYQYDSDSQMYYLYSRYYVPEWNRFLNADIYFDTGTSLIGTNMYAYADNNPINNSDPFGYWAKNDHKEWTVNILSSDIKGTYLSILANNCLEADNKYPAVNPVYQYIHFDRDSSSDDTRDAYALDKIDDAVELCSTGKYSDAMVQMGYGLHASQDIIAHGQIATEWTIADHVIRPGWDMYEDDPVISSWVHADDVTYKWENSDTMRKLVVDSGVTQNNYTTRATRYEETALMTALLMVAFNLSLPSNQRSVFFL